MTLCIECGAGHAGYAATSESLDIVASQLLRRALPDKEGELPRERQELWPKRRRGVRNRDTHVRGFLVGSFETEFMRAERFEIEEISGYKHLSLQEAQRAALPHLAELIACIVRLWQGKWATIMAIFCGGRWASPPISPQFAELI